MKKILFLCFVLLSWLPAQKITIAVSANVAYAISPLKEAFKRLHPNIKVIEIVGSSGKLTAQIRHSAPYDLFLSANMEYPNSLYKEGFAINKPWIYAQGALAILSSKPRNYCAELFILKDPSIDKIAIANPKTAPYGIATVEALKNAKLYKKLKQQFVYGESISQTLIYATGVADIGIVAKSALFSPKLSQYKEAIHWHEINTTLYTPIDQGMVILKRAKDKKAVKAFYDFMKSPKAQEILKAYGYSIP
ncbi:Molybdenum ABC transporter, periplasmic molybdenum-binding protein ModA (TC 3.A.1.8.1) [hydrothermal vent metagenome]|uniref:Molybdenum ABC transporter, periplasmic molybdenum-binding protein ModA (TC 3.A.1.8.1) n=1 Tax=hydrothermal vent metagenome TaxID=652676 RepID=A0A1W1C5F0_9ZZZZ